jgi:hypothetical protein
MSGNHIFKEKRQGGLLTYPILLAVMIAGYKAGVVSYAVVILATCMCLSGMLMHMATAEVELNPDGSRKATFFDRLATAWAGGSKYDSESMNDLIAQFQTDAKDVNESCLLLGSLRRKLKQNEMALLEAANLGLIMTCANFVKNACTDDKRLAPALDIINMILSNTKARAMFQVDEVAVKELVDTLVMSITTHMRPEGEIELSGGNGITIATEHKDDSAPVMTGDQDEDVEFDFSDKATAKEINKYFFKYGFKMLMCLGLLTAENSKLQTLVGDRGAINVVVSCLVNGSGNPQLVKWSAWTMINMVMEHPPNKREFFTKGGLNHLTTAAAKHTNVMDTFQQCVALMLMIVAHDKNTKMNQSSARQVCLGNGIFEICQRGKKNFPEARELHNMIDQLLKILISDWS